ncbi:MAG: hypothetical protein KKB51_15825 [Candidatus Riflebacteria bacterium]|nr:hypothetical protein [Candidatus Riflebacteria bacterium]
MSLKTETVDQILKAANDSILSGNIRDPKPIYKSFMKKPSEILFSIDSLRSLAETFGLLQGFFISWDLFKCEAETSLIIEEAREFIEHKVVVADLEELDALIDHAGKELVEELQRLYWLKNGLSIVPLFVADGLEEGYRIFYDCKNVVESLRK